MRGVFHPGRAREAIGFAVVFVILGVYLVLVARANLDLSDGRFVLFMDERITFDGIRKILHPGEWISFGWAVMDGGDQRYGRSLWNLSALFSYLPEKLWGETGQIVAARMTQVCFLLMTFLLLVFRFVQRWPLRIVLLTTLLVMPYADYYMTMPKPEPLQLLFLAAFLYLYDKKSLGFGWHWLFLGLAFGTKISTLPVILVFGANSWLSYQNIARRDALTSDLKRALLGFVIGLGVSVPILWLPILLSMLSFGFLRFLNRRWRANKLARSLIAGLVASIVFVVSRQPLKVWIGSTFLNTRHGADQASINALSWLNYFIDTWLMLPRWLAILFVALCCGFVGLSFIRLWAARKINGAGPDIGLVILACGLALNLSIFFGAHRLWGFYLFPGSTLTLVGLFSLLDAAMAERAATANGYARTMHYGAFTLLGLVFVISTVFWIPQGVKNLQTLAERTKTEEYLNDYSSYRDIARFLTTYSKSAPAKLAVVYDPWLFPPAENEHYKIVEFWGPYVNWEKSPDVIVFGANHTARGKPYPADSPEFKKYLAERAGYARYVIDKNAPCAQDKCFQREATLPNGGEILTLRKAM